MITEKYFGNDAACWDTKFQSDQIHVEPVPINTNVASLEELPGNHAS